jgi:hypothetical protein
MERELKKLERRIERIKAVMLGMGPMRPGSLTRQPRGGSGAYYQLSYTHRGKGRTEYVRPEFAEDIKKQIANYRRFRGMVDKLIDLEIERSKSKMKIATKEAD